MRAASKSAAKQPVPIDRRKLLALGTAAAVAAVTPVGAMAVTGPIEVARDLFLTKARHAIALCSKWYAIDNEYKALDAAFRSMSSEERRADARLGRVLDLPLEVYHAAIEAEGALRAAYRTRTHAPEAPAVRDLLILSLMGLTGKQPNVLRRELGRI